MLRIILPIFLLLTYGFIKYVDIIYDYKFLTYENDKFQIHFDLADKMKQDKNPSSEFKKIFTDFFPRFDNNNIVANTVNNGANLVKTDYTLTSAEKEDEYIGMSKTEIDIKAQQQIDAWLNEDNKKACR